MREKDRKKRRSEVKKRKKKKEVEWILHFREGEKSNSLQCTKEKNKKK